MNPCTRCGMESPLGSNFCAGCGTSLPKNVQVVSCGAENSLGSRFCKACGKPIGAAVLHTAQYGHACCRDLGGEAGCARTAAGGLRIFESRDKQGGA
jgi:hypothetical protein